MQGVKSDMFLDLKIGKYGFKMDYEDSAILLYGDSIKSIKTNYSYYNILMPYSSFQTI